MQQTSKKENYTRSLITKAWAKGILQKSEDSDYFFWSLGSGGLTSRDLRILADELDRLNGERK